MDPTQDPYFYAKLRQSMARTDPMHAVAGPLEHREFVRDFVGNSGMLAGPSMAAAIPFYTLLKAAGLMPQTRSPASWDEIFAGYQGLFSGLKDRYGSSTPPDTRPDRYANRTSY